MTSAENRPLRVLLVDDHEIVRTGLRALLVGVGMEIAGEASTVAEAIDAAKRLKPDIVLMDVRLPDGSGVEASREIRAAQPETKVLFLTAFEDEDAILATVFANADGHLLKEIGSENLVQAIQAAARGLSVLDPASKRRVLERAQAQATAAPNAGDGELSAQERRVLALVAEGKTNKEIALAMHLSPKTVKNYLSHIFQKLQVTRRSEAAVRFVRAIPGQ
ncbi:MAG: two-component system, NarL family, response regulator DevR [Rugosibacter sp.]|jgi:two-component system response regulator DevR|nr:two-component system, NarL family, response regulator DevR [Rugosibacter sp.]